MYGVSPKAGQGDHSLLLVGPLLVACRGRYLTRMHIHNKL